MHYCAEQSVGDIAMTSNVYLIYCRLIRNCIYQLLPPSTVIPMKLRSSQFVFALPHCHYNLYNHSFVKLKNLDVLFIVLLMPYIVYIRYPTLVKLFNFYYICSVVLPYKLSLLSRRSRYMFIRLFVCLSPRCVYKNAIFSKTN